jgi:hypothetical protein
MKILYNSEKMKRIFDEPPIVSYKRNKNIKDILVHRKHNLQCYGKENGCKALKNSIAFVDKTYHQFVRHKYFFRILYTEYNKLLQQFYNLCCLECYRYYLRYL